MSTETEFVHCKGGCGRYFVYIPAEFLVKHYKGGYCKDCWIKHLEKENELLKAQVAHYEKILANPPIIY